MTQTKDNLSEQTKLKRWLSSVIEQTRKPQDETPLSRRELKAEWRKAAGHRARLA